jgi:hypothetical protein
MSAKIVSTAPVCYAVAMLDDAALATFLAAADDFLRAQELVAEPGQPIRDGIVELLASTSGRIGDCLKGLPSPYRAIRDRGMTFFLIPKADDFSLAAMPEAQVVEVRTA